MRAFWLWLMICLLPLRALAGDAMALQTMPLGGPAASLQMSAPSAPEASGCHGQSHAAQAPMSALGHPDAIHHGDTPADESEHDVLCTVCDICHTTATLSPEPRFATASPGAAVPAHVRGPILSAERLPVHKPPIA